jgi:hypothetical protein
MVAGGGSVTRVHPVTGTRLHHLSASVRPRGHSASGRGRGIHRRASGRRGSGPRPSCCPTLDPKTGRGTSDKPGTARVGPGRRQPPPNPRALHRRSLPSLMLRHVRCSSCLKHYPIQRERILLSGEFAKKFWAELPRTCASVGLVLFPATDNAPARRATDCTSPTRLGLWPTWMLLGAFVEVPVRYRRCSGLMRTRASSMSRHSAAVWFDRVPSQSRSDTVLA